jgi:hypothetical protein
MKFRQSVSLIILLALLSACSTRFLYDRLDWLIVWRVGGFVSLTAEQKDSFRTDLRDHLGQIRIEELPRIAGEIRKVSARLAANEFSAETIEAAYQRALTETDSLMTGLVPLSVNLLMSLDTEQKQELLENLNELNAEMYETYSGTSPEQRRKNRNKSTIKGIQRFTGRLSAGQKQLIDESLTSMADASEEWIAYQRDWQQRFFALLQEQPPREEYESRLTELFIYPRNYHSDEYRQRVDSNRRIMNGMTAQLLLGLSDGQRRRAVAKLDGYAARVASLAESG